MFHWPGRMRVGAFVFLLSCAAAHASSYLLSESQVYYRGSLTYTTATQAWDQFGDLQDLGCRLKRTVLGNQVEYGYSYYHTLFGSIGLGDNRCDPRHARGTGDLNLGIRGRIDPLLNFRAWELAVTIPTHRHQVGVPQIGCGVYGLSGNVDRTDVISPALSWGYGAGLRIWQSPLAHQFTAQTQLTGPIGERAYTRWSWYAGLTYEMPLNDRPTDPVAAANDCGTQARDIRTNTELRYRWSRDVSLSCGVQTTPWGRDVSRSYGLSCAYSYLWE